MPTKEAKPSQKGKETAAKKKGGSKSKTASSYLRVKCIQKNAQGVRIIAENPEKNAQAMAGYLGFDTVTDFKKFITTKGKCALVILVRKGY
jgi:hypothetical protein